MKVAIVEDNKNDSDVLQSHLKSYCKKNDVQFLVTVFTDGLYFLENFKLDYDLIFFDIQMPLLDGMGSAKKIREVDQTVTIVFVTNMPQFALEGYSVEASAFLLKPLKYADVDFTLKRIIPRISALKKSEKVIVLQKKDGFVNVPVDSIVYIEVQEHIVMYHTLADVIEIRTTMKETEQLIANFPQLFRCGNSYIVNLKYIDSLSNNVININGNEIVLSRSKKAEFKKRLAEYLKF